MLERHPDKAAYPAAIRTAAEGLVSGHFLLQEDVAWAVRRAQDRGRPRHVIHFSDED